VSIRSGRASFTRSRGLRHRQSSARRGAVSVDGRTGPRDDEGLSRHGILAGDGVSAGPVERRVRQSPLERARETALRLLAVRSRSTFELSLQLRRRGVPDANVRAVVADLTGGGYLDDLAFARGWVATRAGARAYGVARLRRELREKGVAIPLIERAIREAYGEEDYSVTEERNARALIERRRPAYRHLPADVRTRRLAGFLERRGFSPHTITRVLGAAHRAAADAPDG